MTAAAFLLFEGRCGEALEFYVARIPDSGIEARYNPEGLMKVRNDGSSPKFAWVNDRFGLFWQTNLP